MSYTLSGVNEGKSSEVNQNFMTTKPTLEVHENTINIVKTLWYMYLVIAGTALQGRFNNE